jgi:hypothetical protein
VGSRWDTPLSGTNSLSYFVYRGLNIRKTKGHLRTQTAIKFPLHTSRNDFSASRPLGCRALPSVPSSSTSATYQYSRRMPSERKLTLPKDPYHSGKDGEDTLSPVSPSIGPTRSLRPPGSFKPLNPNGIRTYEAMLREAYDARRERRLMNFTPESRVERVQMSFIDFSKLYNALGAGEEDSRYVFTALKKVQIVTNKTKTAGHRYRTTPIHQPLLSSGCHRLPMSGLYSQSLRDITMLRDISPLPLLNK